MSIAAQSWDPSPLPQSPRDGRFDRRSRRQPRPAASPASPPPRRRTCWRCWHPARTAIISPRTARRTATGGTSLSRPISTRRRVTNNHTWGLRRGARLRLSTSHHDVLLAAILGVPGRDADLQVVVRGHRRRSPRYRGSRSASPSGTRSISRARARRSPARSRGPPTATGSRRRLVDRGVTTPFRSPIPRSPVRLSGPDHAARSDDAASDDWVLSGAAPASKVSVPVVVTLAPRLTIPSSRE